MKRILILKACGSSDESHDVICMTWADFSTKLCAAECMNDDCILMLSCCRGGLMQVVKTNHRNLSKYELSERRLYTWMKHNGKQMNEGVLKPESY